MKPNDNSSSTTSGTKCGCDGCDGSFDPDALTECRYDYPDESWEWFKFCPECLKADAF